MKKFQKFLLTLCSYTDYSGRTKTKRYARKKSRQQGFKGIVA